MSGLQQEELGGNPAVPGSGENGGRRNLSPELIEHRLGQLEQTTKKNGEDIADIKITVTKIESGMITKSQLVLVLVSLLFITAMNLIVWMAK